MSLIRLVFSVSPILAPLSGSLVIAFGDWRSMFWVVTIVGTLGFARAYGTLLRNGRLMGLPLIATFGMSSFMAFLGNSSFVYVDHFGPAPTQYSLAVSVNALNCSPPACSRWRSRARSPARLPL